MKHAKSALGGRLRRGLWGGLSLLAGVLACGSAFADPAIPGQPNTALHVGKRALDQVGALALQKLPTHIDVPSIDSNLLNICPNGPIALQIRQAYVDLAPTSLEFQTKDGALGINALLDISGFAQITVARGYACVDDAQCDVSFSAKALNPTATVSLAVTNGQPTASIGQAGVAADLHLEFHNCILDKQMLRGAIDGVANKLLEMSQGIIGEQVNRVVSPLIETQIKAMATVSANMSGYGFAATLTDLRMTATGIDAYAAVGVDYEGTIAACIPTDAPTADRNPTLVGSAMALPTDDKSSVVVGVSTDLVSNAIAAAWRSGLMCMDDVSLTTLGFDPSQLGSLVPGLPLGLQLKFYVTMAKPPTVETDGHGALRMRVMGAALHLTMTVPGQPDSTAMLSTDFTVAITPDVDPLSGTIFASLGDMSMERLELHADRADATYSVDPERMTVMVRDVVVPMAAAKLKTMPLSPASFNVAGFYAWLNNVSVRNSAFYAGVDAYVPGPASDDTDLPTTTMDKRPGELVRAGMVRYQVGGSDDQTPSQLLRYEWQLDEQTIAPPAFTRIIQVPVLTAGQHTFRVRAVDLTGKGSSTWKSHSFIMDLVPPTLTVLEQPQVAARVKSAKVRFTGTDDQSEPNLLSYAYRLSSKDPGDETKFVREVQPTGMIDGVAELDITDLSEGTVYEATLMLYDEAGNVTSKKVGFAAAAAGCSVGGSPSASWFSLFLVAVALLVHARLGRRRATAC